MPARRLVRASDVPVQELDGELLLLVPGSSDVLHLDVMAAQLWALFDQPSTVDEVAGLLAETYGVPPDQVAADLHHALEVMVAFGLLLDA